MRLVNYTPVETELLRKIIRFARPSGIGNFDITFKNAGAHRGFSGYCYHHGSVYHCESIRSQGKARGWSPLITIKIPRDGEIAYPHITDFSKSHGGYLRSVQFTKNEDIVHLVAHELRHLWQAKVPRGRRVWGARGQFSERDADAYAIRKVREWRRLST